MQESARRRSRAEYATSKEEITLNGEQMEDVEEFVYLGGIVDKEGEGG